MSARVLRATVTGFIGGLAAACLMWALAHESSPLYDYFLWNPTILDVWRILNFPVLVALLITRIDYPPFALLLIFIQWFILGFLGYWALTAIRGKLSRRNAV